MQPRQTLDQAFDTQGTPQIAPRAGGITLSLVKRVLDTIE